MFAWLSYCVKSYCFRSEALQQANTDISTNSTMYLEARPPTVHTAEVPAASAPLLGVHGNDASWVLQGVCFPTGKGPLQGHQCPRAPVSQAGECSHHLILR